MSTDKYRHFSECARKKCLSTFILGNIAWSVGPFICTSFFFKAILVAYFQCVVLWEITRKTWYRNETSSGCCEIQNFPSLKEGIELCKILVPNFCRTIETAWNKRYSSENILLSFSLSSYFCSVI